MASVTTTATVTTVTTIDDCRYVENPGPKQVTNRTYEGGNSPGTLCFQALIWEKEMEARRGGRTYARGANNGVSVSDGERKRLAKTLHKNWRSRGGEFLKSDRVWVLIPYDEKELIVRRLCCEIGNGITQTDATYLVAYSHSSEMAARAHGRLVQKWAPPDDFLLGEGHDQHRGNTQFCASLRGILESTLPIDDQKLRIKDLMRNTSFRKFSWQVETDNKAIEKKILKWIESPREVQMFAATLTAPLVGPPHNSSPPNGSANQRQETASLLSDISIDEHGVTQIGQEAPGLEADPLLGIHLPEVRLPYADTYNSADYQSHFNRLSALVDSGYQGVPTVNWDIHWARHVTQHHEARELDGSRRVCLKLLFDMFNDHRDHGLDVAILRGQFNESYVSNILQVCLPMDRANALHHMQVVRGPTCPRGIHWVSENQMLNPLIQRAMRGYPGTHSMNKRFEWLLSVFGLREREPFVDLMKPVFIREWITDIGALDELEMRLQAGDNSFKLQNRDTN